MVKFGSEAGLVNYWSFWILMCRVPVPEFGALGRDVPLLDKGSNPVAWLDRHLLHGPL